MANNEGTKFTNFSNVEIGTASGGGRLILGGVEQNISSESVITTKTITAAESGSTFILNLAAGFVTTLPAPSAGLKYKFIVGTAPTGSYTIVTNASANVIHGQIASAEDAAGSVSTTAASDTISFVLNLAIIGDYCEVISDGTSWFVSGLCNVQDGMTTTQAS